ncbi:MAG: NUDIX pyrophosphatase [Geobacteraceae bacterium]|nr:NUDIX pyrophosphatase [Geobacteraceae bacterium]
MQITKVITAFLRHKGKVLLLQRSSEVGTYQGCWAAVSGHLEGDSPLERAYVEIEEETGLNAAQLSLVTHTDPLEIMDHGIKRHWRIYPFLFEVEDETPRIVTDWEHQDWRWVEAAELKRFATVPRLAETLEACLEQEQHGRR